MGLIFNGYAADFFGFQPVVWRTAMFFDELANSVNLCLVGLSVHNFPPHFIEAIVKGLFVSSSSSNSILWLLKLKCLWMRI